MFLTSTFFLFLSPISIFAENVPRVNDVKTHEHDQQTSCLSYKGFSNALITFNGPHEIDLFDYAVVTKYTTYYRNILTHALVFNGFTVLTLANDRVCGWQKVTSVHGILGLDFNNHRGDIYWKPNDLRMNDQEKDKGTPSDQSPNKETIDKITRILLDNPPAGDVYMFYTIILAWSTSLLGYMLFMILLMACIKKCDRSADKTRDTEIDDGIELGSIKAPSTVSLAVPTAAAIPLEDIKYIYTSPQHSATTSSQETRSEILPAYPCQG